MAIEYDHVQPKYRNGVPSRLADETDEEYEDRLDYEAEIERDQEARFRAIAAVYEKADRILTEDPLTVKLTNSPDKPAAWSDGRTITLNTAVLSNVDDSDLVSLHGANWHEVCHILFSPRAGSEIMKWVVQNEYLQAFNILEDQRIETLFTARFPSTRPFLEATILRYVANEPWNQSKRNEFIEMAHPLLRGRRYVSKAFRNRIETDYTRIMGADTVSKVNRLVDEYRLLIFPKDTTNAKRIVEEFAEFVSNNPYLYNPGQCANREPMKIGRADPMSAQTADKDRANDMRDGGTFDSDLDNDTYPSNGADDSDEKLNNQELPERGSNDELIELINNILTTIESSKEVRAETRVFRKAVQQVETVNSTIKITEFGVSSPKAEDVTAAKEFGSALRLIEEEAQPMWERQTPTGKLNISRAMSSDINDINRMFDRWYEGSDAVDIEAAVLLDRSGSMSAQMNDACRSLWTIKRGLERVGARVTAYTFGSTSRLLYSAGEKAAPGEIRTMYGSGGTNPVKALEETEFIMEASERATKMVFLITDGWWEGTIYADKLIRRMQNMGVFVTVVFIGNLDYLEKLSAEGDQKAAKELASLTHGANMVRAVQSTKDLVKVARTVVTKYLKERVGR